MKKTFLLLITIVLANLLQAQPDAVRYAHGLFHGTHIINGHSLETQREGDLELFIGHRFGRINGGAYEFFGLDQADMRLGFEYGVNDRIAVGVGRSSVGKTFDSFGKVRILRQQVSSEAMPISLTWFSSIAVNSLRPIDNTIPTLFSSRLYYTHQVMIGRKFSDGFSLQLMPTLVHRNLVDTRAEKNDVFGIGAATRYRVSKHVAITAEYYYVFKNQLAENKRNSLSLGLDLDTGSHVFQIHLTNSNGMMEKAFFTETTGSWLNGDIHLGFNMTRIFRLKGRRF